MTTLFDNIYKTKSSRLPERDYSEPGSYFITICTQNRKSYFGEVIDGEMKLNDMGDIVNKEITLLDNVEVDVCMIMPNHIHLIITIYEDISVSVETSIHGVSPNDSQGHAIHQHEGHAIHQHEGHAINRVSTIKKGGFAGNKNPMNNKKSISYIIRQLKGKTTFLIRKHFPSFKRQSNYYEHVIRNDRDFERIHTYISNNPLKRRNDEYYR